MTNAVFTETKKFFLKGVQDAADAGNLKIVLVNQDYTYSAAHDFLNDIIAGQRIATATLTSVTTTGGTLDAADPTFTAVTGVWGTDYAKAAVIYIDAASVDANSRLINYIEFTTPLYLSPNQVNFTLQFDALGIIRLVDPA